MRKTPYLAAVITASAIAVAGCGSSGSSGGGGGGGGGSASVKNAPKPAGPFRILDITSLTGPIGPFGTSELTGVKAAVAELNQGGGIDGHKVILTVKDDGSNPTTGVTLLNSAISSSTPPNLIFPGVTGSDGVAMAPIANAHEIVNFTAAPTDSLGDPTTSPYTFLTNPSYTAVGKWGADAIYADGYKTAAIVYSQDQPGSDEQKGFVSEYEKLGGKVVKQVTFNPTQTSFTSTLESAYSADPAAVFVMNEGQGAPELQAHYVAGASKPFFCDTGCSLNYQTQVPGGITHLVNTYGQELGTLLWKSPAQRTAEQKAYYQAFTAAGGIKIGAGDYLPSLDYDAVMLTAAAAKQADSFSGPAIKHALENLKGDNSYAVGFNPAYSSTSHFLLPSTAPNPFYYVPLNAPYDAQTSVFKATCANQNKCSIG